MQKRHAFEGIKSDLEALEMFEEARKWTSLGPLLDVDLSKFRAIAVGRYNTGKSTLLNVLCDRFDDEWFKTADVIETTEVKEAEYKGVVYVDTPGLGTTHLEDDLKSRGISLSASVVLFVHSCIAGELDAEELGILERLAAERDNPAEQIVILCSKTRDMEQEKDVENIVKKIRRQIKGVTSMEINVITIDSLDYRDGKKKNEPALLDTSNIPTLTQWLKERQRMKNPTERQFDAVKAEVSGKIAERKIALETKAQQQLQKGTQAIRSLLGIWQGLLRNSIDPARRRCRECAEKIKELERELNHA
jgi:predicted GTPase